MKRFLQWLKEIRPVTARHADARVRETENRWSNEVARLRSRHEKELEEEKKIAANVLAKFHNQQWRRGEHGAYALMVEMSPQVARCMGFPGELRFLADSVCHEVRRQILTTKFVESAKDLDRAIRNEAPNYFRGA